MQHVCPAVPRPRNLVRSGRGKRGKNTEAWVKNAQSRVGFRSDGPTPDRRRQRSQAIFDWSPLITNGREDAMSTRRRFKQVTSLKDRLIQEAENLRRQAQESPPGIRRDELLRKARQAETAARVDDWLASPGLQPPK